MLINRNIIIQLQPIFNKIKQNTNIGIYTQYNFLKLKKIYEDELSIFNEQKERFMNYCEPTSNPNEFKIKDEYLEQCTKELNQLNSISIQIPDIYFSLDELESLNLTFEELELLMPFIK
jgi:hypothetical protein